MTRHALDTVSALCAPEGATAESERIMSSETKRTMTWMTAALAAAVSVFGCSKEEPKSEAPAASAATVQPVASAPPSAPPPPAATPAPVVSASVPVHDCPKGSTGDGSFNKPCDGKGGARMMEVAWTGKMDEKGPSFRITNKSSSVILYGKILIYYYDKAGKQLEVKETPTSAPKPFQTCAGAMFGGVMKAGEKAVITFSCFKKEHVPQGTAAIEGEMQVVGFADSSEKKVEYYWRNNDLTPDQRKKGGIK